MGVGECEIGFSVEKARFARGVGHGGEEWSNDSLRLSARKLAMDTINKVEG